MVHIAIGATQCLNASTVPKQLLKIVKSINATIVANIMFVILAKNVRYFFAKSARLATIVVNALFVRKTIATINGIKITSGVNFASVAKLIAIIILARDAIPESKAFVLGAKGVKTLVAVNAHIVRAAAKA